MSVLSLIGPMGAGKSTIGRLLAARLTLECIDLDAVIVERAGKSITDIFADDGECIFRALESECLQSLCAAQSSKILATGGGIVLTAPNRQRLKQAGTVVWLDAPVEVLAKRTAGDKKRPLLAGVNVLLKAKELDLQRRKYYEMCSDLRVDTSQLSAAQVVQCIVAHVEAADV
ncbi:MAG: shikimate kinase [Mariprofundaceae bacterium]